MSQPLGRLLRSLVGRPRPKGALTLQRTFRRDSRRSAGVPSLAAETLESRSMLAVTISLTGSNALLIDQVTPTTETIGVTFSTGKVVDPADATKSSVVQGVTVQATTTGLTLPANTFFPFQNPYTSAQVTGVIILQKDASAAVAITDEIGFIGTISGGASWTTSYNTADLGGQTLQIQNTPSSVTLTSPATVAVSGTFTANDGDLTVVADSVVVGPGAAAVTANTITLDTATNGGGAVQLVGNLTANDTLTIVTNAQFNITTSVRANQTNLTLNAGGTQTGGSIGTVGVAPQFYLVAGGDVSFGLTANTLGDITSISAAGKSVRLASGSPVTQSGPIEAATLYVKSLGAVTLDDPDNEVDSLGISANGAVEFVNSKAVALGVDGVGVSAGTSNPVTITTKGNLTQSTSGAVVAGTFTANIFAPQAGGNSNLLLNSANNQVSTFIATNNSAGGGITLANTPIGLPLTLGDGTLAGGVTALNGPISITNGSGIVVASPVSAGSLGTMSLTSVGAITQNAAATLTAKSLTVVNNDVTGAITLNLSNDVRNVAITNVSPGGIDFKGSNASTGSLAVGVGGSGISAGGGTVRLDADGRKMVVNSGITVSGDVVLAADGGVTQVATAAIVANGLTVMNTTAGVVTLDATGNDVANLAITNNTVSGTVNYTDLNDLSLKTGGGIVAGDSISLVVGGGFTSTAGNVLNVAGGTGTISLAAAGNVAFGGTVTAKSGVTVNAGTTAKVSNVAVNAALSSDAGPVSITGTGAVSSSAAGTISGDSVSLNGATGISLAAAVAADVDAIVLTSTAGPLATTAAATLTAATAVSTNSVGAATFGGLVTADTTIDVIAGNASTTSAVSVNAAFLALAGVTVSATGAITTAATITGDTVNATSGGATTLGDAVTSTGGAITLTSGGTFTSTVGTADIVAAGAASVTSTGAMALTGGVSGASVALTAGTTSSPAGITLLDSVGSTGGDVTVSAVGGGVTTGLLAPVTSAGGNLAISGTTGVSLGAIVTSAGTVAVTAASGPVLVNDVTAATSVGLAAANGVSQTGGTAITAASLTATNSTAGSIGLANADNNVATFSATNSAAGGAVFFQNKQGVAIAGVSTSNGVIDLTAAGAVALVGSVTAGTGNVAIKADGTISQAATAKIVGANLKVDTTIGDVLLGTCPSNDVDFLFGSNVSLSGKFEFTDADDLGVTTPTNGLSTADGDITIVSGQLGVGPMTVGGAVSAGAGLITLQANGGITGLSLHAITSSKGLQLSNDNSGDITLLSVGNGFPTLSAVTATGTAIKIFDSQSVTLVNNGPTAGLSAVGGTISLTVQGGVDQDFDAPVIANAATFVVQGTVDLSVSAANDVATLAIQNTGLGATISYADVNDLTIGVGTSGVVSTLGDIDVTSLTGSLTLNANVTTSSLDNTIDLTAGGGSITQPAGSITTGNLIMTSPVDIIVAQSANVITNLRASAANILRYVNASSFEVGLDRSPVAPDTAGTTVTVVNNDATFNQVFTVTTPDGITRPLIAGDVLVIAAIPYRVKSVVGLTASLISPDGLPANYPALTTFDVLTPQVIEVSAGDVNLNSVGGNVRVTAEIVGGMTLTAGGVVEYVVTSTESAQPGSLREMIGYANANQGTRTVSGVVRWQPMQIVFDELNYPVQDIFVTSALPAIQKPVDILGARVEANVSDYARVGVDGTGVTATSIVNGLRYAAGSQGSTASGLAVYGFATGAGVQVVSGLNTFVNNYVGVRRDGTTLSSNKIGFELTGLTSTTNTIGTYVVDEALANVIGGNAFAGIVARNGATANAIVGNYIGTDSLGADLGNFGDGIMFEGVNGNVVGTRTAVLPDGTPAASNVIANNNNSGIRIVGARAATAALGNLIENNRIDGNSVHGIEITASTFQSIGGSAARQSNVITGQLTGSGVRIAQSTDVSVVANYIGVNAAGTPNLGNAASGVLIDGSLRTLVNGGNSIASNGTGVTIRNGSAATRVEGNWIGTDSSGNPLGNVNDGVLIDRSIGNFVRAGNTIANNRTNGVSITDSVASSSAAGNFVTGNVISANGNAGTGAGVRVSGGAGHTIGLAGVGNVITANAGEGICVERSPLTGSSANIRIQANYVGTNANQETDPALGNGLGIRLSRATAAVVNGQNVVINNLSDGVRIEGTSGSVVGGTTAGSGNVISGNGGNGVTITDVVSGVALPVKNSGNSVYGNQISGNTGSGVYVRGVTTNGASTTSNVLVGVATTPGKPVSGNANVISGNGGAGVTIDGAQAVLVSGNSIYDNVGVPIQIVNDGNRGAAAPNLTSAVLVQKSNSVSQAVVSGTFARQGAGTVTVVSGTATFSTPQATLRVGSVVVVNGVAYTVAQKVSNTVFRLAGNPTLTTAGTGRVSSSSGTATFSVPQSPALVGRSIIVAGRSYAVTSLSANGRTARLAGAPTFNVSAFATVAAFSFSVVDASLLNQQYVVDIFLNQPADGDPSSGDGYGMRTFIGQATVTIGPTGTGAFSVTVNLPSGISSVGQYITATATTVRASADVSAFSTSSVSPKAKQLVFASPAR